MVRGQAVVHACGRSTGPFAVPCLPGACSSLPTMQALGAVGYQQ